MSRRAAGLLLALALVCAISTLSARSALSQNEDDADARSQPPSQAADAESSKESSAKSEDEEPLPKYEDMIENIPTVKQLLQEPPVDWVVLKNGDVIVCEPVTPRPRTLEKMEERIAESYKWPRGKTPEERDEQVRKREELHYLTIILPEGGEEPEWQLHMRHVEQIVHHEDLILKRTEILQDEGDFAPAFEMLFNLKRGQPNWPGIEQTHNRLLLLEAKHRLEQDKTDSAFVLLEELHGRDPKYPDLKKQLGAAADRLISAAVDRGDFRRARHVLGRLVRREPGHETAAKWRDDLLARAQKLLDAARAAREAGRHDVAARTVEQAAVVWPDTPGLRSAHELMTRRFQRLEVGVQRFSGETSPYFLPTPADVRERGLTRSLLFEPDAIDEVVQYQSRFFEQWEPADLGRRTVFSLVRNRPDWQSQPIVGAAAVAETLRRRLDPNHPDYDERLDSYIDSLTVLSPTDFLVRFERVPPRMESVFRFPIVGTASAGNAIRGVPSEARDAERHGGRSLQDAEVAAEGSTRPQLVSRRFQPHDSAAWTERKRTYRRAVPEPDGAGEYHVAEVVETRYDSHEKAIQGLFRGEVSLLPHIRPRDVDALRADVRFNVHQYALPVMHVLQFNPGSEPLRNRELRRALEYALDRPRMLRETVLRDSAAQYGRVASAPFPASSYAHSSVVEPREHNLMLGVALTLAAKTQLEGDIPQLKMICAPGPSVRAAAEKIVAQWKRIGLDVTLVTAPSAAKAVAAGEWDIVYRTYKMADPVVELWPMLTLDERARVESLRHFPDWLRQELIELDTARDWKAAVGILHDLHAHLAAEAWLIPLWEVDDFLVVRKNLRGLREKPLFTYHDVERWRIVPWYPTETP